MPDAPPDAPAPAAGPEADRGDAAADDAPLVLQARGIAWRHGRKTILADLDLVLRAGEAVAVLGPRNSGKSVLARVLAGLAPPDRGRLWWASPPAPLVGGPTGFGVTASVERDLGLRAAAYGISTRDHIADVAALLDDPGVLALPFKRLDGVSRVVLTFGASYLTPSDIYVIDGMPLPQVPAVRARIAALFDEVRQRAGVVWLSSAAGNLRSLAPARCLELAGGRLRALDGYDEAEARFLPQRGKLPALSDPDDEDDDG